jgi:long-chain acyl-CoA synthetase
MTEKKITYADKPWLNVYKLGPFALAKSLDYPKIPLYKILDDAAAKYPNNVAILFKGRTITYQELKLYTDKLATALVDLGVKKGDRVAVMMPNSPQIIISMFGIIRGGAVYVPITPLAKGPELEHVLNQSGTELIITFDEHLELINSVKDKSKLREIIITTRKDYSPEEEPEIKEVPGTRNLRSLLKKYEAKPPEYKIDTENDLTSLAFTGGATGVPKGVMRTHSSDMAFIMSQLPWLLKPMEAGARGKASFLVPIPLYHGAGQNLVMQCIYWGLRLILIADPRDTDAIIEATIKYRPFIIMAVPTQLFRMVQKKVGKTTSLVTSATAPLPLATAELWKKETGMPVTQGYALTEGGSLMNLSAFSKLTGFVLKEKHSLGVPGPDLEAKLVDPDTGQEVPVGEVGEIWIRGPQVMLGYWPTPGSGLKDGWLPTGDVGRMDEEGYFYMEDRVKDMVNVSGLKVYTVTVDEVLFKHPAVAVAIAIGIPDPQQPGSERIKAYIKVKDGYEGKVTADDIIAHCRANLPPYAAPRFVEFRDELPVTSASEKLFKRALREEEIAKMKARGELK